MATQTKVQKYFGKRTLPPTQQVQTKISSFLKRLEEKEIDNEVIYVGGRCLYFCGRKRNLQHSARMKINKNSCFIFL